MRCQKCGNELKPNAKFCPSCGEKVGAEAPIPAPVQNDILKCVKCGTALKPNAKFCPSCGEKVNVQTTAPTPVQNETLKCAKCGTALKPNAKFCPSCGEKTGENIPSPIPEPVQTNNAQVPENTEDSKPETKEIPEKTEKDISEDKKPAETDKSSETAPKDKSKCTKCGKEFDSNLKFCPSCSEKVSAVQTKSVSLSKNKDKENDTVKDNTPKAVPVPPSVPAEENKCLCGANLKPNAKFCPICGKKVGAENNAQNSSIPTPVNDTQNNQNSQIPTPVNNTPDNQGSAIPNGNIPNNIPQGQGFAPAPNGNIAATAVKKPIDKKTLGIICGIAAAAIIVLVIVVLVMNRTPKITLNDYMTVEYEGYNGYGTASARFDSERFLNDWKGKLKYNSVDNNEIMDYIIDTDEDPAEGIASLIKYSYSLSDNSYLSNGDKIKLSWSFKTAKTVIETYVKCEVDDSEKEFVVADLNEVTSFDPFDKFHISYSGYNGNGKATYSSDYSLIYELDKTSNLTNGDTIHVTVSSPRGGDLAEYCVKNIGSVPGQTSKDFTVDGLSDMGTFDPFDGISVSFEGTEPNGTAEIVNNSDKSLKYTLDKTKNLKNGDKVVVTVTGPYGADLTTYCKEHYEQVPSSSTKEFTVAGLPKYVTAPADIPEDTLKKLKSESEDQIKSNITSDGEKLDKLEYQGTIVLNIKDGKTVYSWGSSYDQEHMYYLVYKVTVNVKGKDNNQKSYTYWTYCRFYNMTILSDGTCSVDISDVIIPNERTAPKDAYFEYYGFDTYDTLFSKVVTSRLDNYKYETDIKNNT